MGICAAKEYIGKDVVLEYHIGCQDTLPAESDWKIAGSMRTKEFEAQWDSADGTSDRTRGSLRNPLSTFLTFGVSGDGTSTATGVEAENQKELIKHFFSPDATGGQPDLWARLTYPDLTFICYCRMSSYSRSAPYDDVCTWSTELEGKDSEFGLIVEDTPDANAPAVTSVAVVPDTLTLIPGSTFDAEAVIAPAQADQRVRWTSSAPGVAAVNQITGVITGVALGSATITAESVDDPTKTDTTAVTVVSQVESIDASPTTISVEEAATQQITASVLPATAPQGLTYTSLDTDVATVSGSGLVTGVAAGTTTVVVRSVFRPGVSVSIPVEVTAP